MILDSKTRLDTALRAAVAIVTGSSVLTADPDHAGWSATQTLWRALGSEMVRVDLSAVPSPSDITALNAVIDAFDPSQSAQDADDNVKARALADAIFANLNGDTAYLAKAMRGLALVALDEINLLREWVVAFKVQAAAATNLANLQTRIASLPDMPDRTAAQLEAAIRGKVNAGMADS